MYNFKPRARRQDNHENRSEDSDGARENSNWLAKPL